MREFFSLKNQHSVVPLCGFEVSRATKGAPCSACVSVPGVDLFDYYGGGCGGFGPWPAAEWGGAVWNHDIVLSTDNMMGYVPPGYTPSEDGLNAAKTNIEKFNELRTVYTLQNRYYVSTVSYSTSVGAVAESVGLYVCGCNCPGDLYCGSRAKLRVYVYGLGGPNPVPAEAHYNNESTESISDGERTLYIKSHYVRVDSSPYSWQTPTECYHQYRNFGWECWKMFPETFTLTLIEPPV